MGCRDYSEPVAPDHAMRVATTVGAILFFASGILSIACAFATFATSLNHEIRWYHYAQWIWGGIVVIGFLILFVDDIKAKSYRWEQRALEAKPEKESP